MSSKNELIKSVISRCRLTSIVKAVKWNLTKLLCYLYSIAVCLTHIGNVLYQFMKRILVKGGFDLSEIYLDS